MVGLNQVVILDFSKLLPGPWCTMLLADLGCRVVKVELPHWPDILRAMAPVKDGLGFVYRMANRNKESVCLDFRKPEGRRVLDKMLAQADAVVEGFRPGLMERLGLGPKALLKKHPKLVYCSITGFGSAGESSGRPGHDANFIADSGLLGAGDSNGSLSFGAAQIGDMAGAHYAANGLLAALLESRLTGKGKHVSVSMSEAAFSWLVLPVGHQLASGKPYDKDAGHWWAGGEAFYRLYKTQDGRWLCVAALERGFAEALLREVGRPELIAALSKLGSGRALIPELEKIFMSKPLSEWETLLGAKDVCVTPVRSVPEAVARFSQAPAPGIPPLVAGGWVRSPVRASRGDFKLRRKPPVLGADNEAALKSFGLPAKAIAGLKKAKILVRSEP